MNTVIASFNITARQMTEMPQLPRCLSKNDQNVWLKKIFTYTSGQLFAFF